MLHLRYLKGDVYQAAGDTGEWLGRDAWLGTLIWDMMVLEALGLDADENHWHSSLHCQEIAACLCSLASSMRGWVL